MRALCFVTDAYEEPQSEPPDRYAQIRSQMVERQLRARGIRDERVLAAMAAVPRHPFVPASLRHLAYDDRPVPIGLEQTISQPYMVATALEALALDGTERVLDVGTGSGYQAALLGWLAREVVSVEILPELAARATLALAAVEATNVRVFTGDGGLGWPQAAPYDAIVVAAACPAVPKALARQLDETTGRLVLPLGDSDEQTLMRVRYRDGELVAEPIAPCVFVPLTGAAGFDAAGDGRHS